MMIRKAAAALAAAVSAMMTTATIVATVTAPTAYADEGGHAGRIRHVLLVSIDGMHAVDYLNRSRGISGLNGGKPYCPNLAELGETAVNYLDTSTSRPSDSFPGLTAIISGSSPPDRRRLLRRRLRPRARSADDHDRKWSGWR